MAQQMIPRHLFCDLQEHCFPCTLWLCVVPADSFLSFNRGLRMPRASRMRLPKSRAHTLRGRKCLGARSARLMKKVREIVMLVLDLVDWHLVLLSLGYMLVWDMLCILSFAGFWVVCGNLLCMTTGHTSGAYSSCPKRLLYVRRIVCTIYWCFDNTPVMVSIS